VRFHDGAPFTAEDVEFSFARAIGRGSNIAGALAAIREVRSLDDHTVDLITEGADPILPQKITGWDIMSKAWCEQNQAARAADLGANEENYATAHANGTGPFILKERVADQETVLVRNPVWWDRPEHDLDEVVFRPVPDPDARIARLLSGDLDMIYSVPADDLDVLAKAARVRLVDGPELRTLYLGFDVGREELIDSDVRGRNPLRDIRVRKAFYQAIDENAIKSKVMRGFAVPTGLMIGRGINGFDPALDKRLLPFDPEAARRLLAQAGYAEGFKLGMDCPRDRYINDEGICQAVVAMLARIGVKADALIEPRAKFFAKVLGEYKTSFYLLGWAPQTYDAADMLDNVLATRDDQGHGAYNAGGYSNPVLDRLIGQIGAEADQGKRLDLIRQALMIAKEDVATIPLHQQVLIWAVRDNIDLAQPADGFFPLRYVRVK
jgi:peptide/nickel transport system substrate-binding protein